jgi:hypothetical protein
MSCERCVRDKAGVIPTARSGFSAICATPLKYRASHGVSLLKVRAQEFAADRPAFCFMKRGVE